MQKISHAHGPISGLEIYGHGNNGFLVLGKYYYFDSEKIPFSSEEMKGVFSKDATIKLNSCSSGKGDIGREFSQMIGKHYLQKGGKVYSSKAYILSSFARKFPGSTITGPVVKEAALSNSLLMQLFSVIELLSKDKNSYKFDSNTISEVYIPPAAKK